MNCQIITAYSYSSKFRQYIVAAYVRESNHPGLPRNHTFHVLANYAIDESKDTAMQEAIARIYDDNLRHPQNMPIINKGRMSREIVTGFHF